MSRSESVLGGGIEDTDEYNKRRRSKRIHEARERVLDQRRRALDLKAQGIISQRQYLDILREAVESLILELENKVYEFEDNHAEDDLPSYWNEAELGEAVMPDGTLVEFNGMQSIIEFPDPYVATWAEVEEAPPGYSHHPEGRETVRREEAQIPDRILMNGYRLCNSFLDRIGLDLSLNFDLGDAGFSIDDIQMELPEDDPSLSEDDE